MSDQPHPWHALSGAEAQQRLATPPGGLGTAEIERRRRQHGPNRLAPPRRRGHHHVEQDVVELQQ